MAFLTNQILKGKERQIYARIGYIHGDKLQQNYRIDYFEDAEASSNIENKWGEFWQQFKPDLEKNDNFIKQAYRHAKSFDIFIDAEDC